MTSLLFSILAILLSFQLFASGLTLGGWKPIKDLSDPTVVRIAEFAVTTYNRSSGSRLKLVRVIKGETQVVADLNYRLVIHAHNMDVSYSARLVNIQSVVYASPGGKELKLVSLDRLLDQN